MNIGKISGAWSVGGTSIFEPASGTKIEHENVAGESSGRTEDGVMHIDWVRRDVRKVYMQYKALTEAELATIINLVQGKEFSFTYPDLAGSVTIPKAYCSRSSYSKYGVVGNTQVYTDIAFDIIEV